VLIGEHPELQADDTTLGANLSGFVQQQRKTPRARRTQSFRHGFHGVTFAFIALLAFSF
jgi:hypothetical protein